LYFSLSGHSNDAPPHALPQVAKINLKLLNVTTAQEFGMVVAAVGLAQNFAALRALATEVRQSNIFFPFFFLFGCNMWIEPLCLSTSKMCELCPASRSARVELKYTK
jgi:hypothetical protein